MPQHGMASSAELKSMGLKATLPRLKSLEIFQRSTQVTGVRHLSAEDVYKALLAEHHGNWHHHHQDPHATLGQ